MTNVEQTQKMIPLVTSKISLVQNVSKFVLGVYVFDLDFWIQIYSIEHPVKNNFVGSGIMSHCRTSSLYDHLDHCFGAFKHDQHFRSLITLRDCLRL